MGSKVRFYSKSRDEFSKKIYRKIYYGMGILRKMQMNLLIFLLIIFSILIKEIYQKLIFFVYCFSELSNKRIKSQIVCFFEFNLIIDVLFYSPARDPPGILFDLFV